MTSFIRAEDACRILVVIGSLNLGGTEKHLLAVLPKLAALGFDIKVFVVIERGELADELEREGVSVQEPALANWVLRHSFPPFRGVLSQVLRWLSLALFMLRWRPNLVHCFLTSGYVFGGAAAVLFGRRLLMSRRSRNFYLSEKPMRRRFEAFLHRHLDAGLGNSAAVIEDLLSEGVSRARLGLLPNGVSAHDPDKDAVTKARMSLGLPDRCFVMICVANLIPYKAHNFLLQSIADVAPEFDGDWRLVCVGRDDGIGADLAATATSLGIADNVIWTGPRRDVGTLLGLADLGLLVSDEEGMSNSVLESLSAGIPVVATDVGGNSEVLSRLSEDLIVPPRDRSALGRAILRLANDDHERKQLGKAAKALVSERYAFSLSVARYAAVYRWVEGERNGSLQDVIDRTAS